MKIIGFYQSISGSFVLLLVLKKFCRIWSQFVSFFHYYVGEWYPSWTKLRLLLNLRNSPVQKLFTLVTLNLCSMCDPRSWYGINKKPYTNCSRIFVWDSMYYYIIIIHYWSKHHSAVVISRCGSSQVHFWAYIIEQKSFLTKIIRNISLIFYEH